VDVPPGAWAAELADAGFDPHLQEHLLTMARLHRQNRYDRVTHTVHELTGTPAQTIESFVAEHAELFTPGRPRPGDQRRRRVLGIGADGAQSTSPWKPE